MNALYNTPFQAVAMLSLVIWIMSLGLALMAGGPKAAKSFVKWSFGKWGIVLILGIALGIFAANTQPVYLR